MTGFSFRLAKASLAALAAVSPAAAMAQDGHAAPGQIGLQTSVTPIMDSITAFHDNLLMWIITAITLFVLALLIWVIVRYNQRANPTPSRTTHNTLVEIVWTVVPILILIVIAIPSFGVLADQETIPDGERSYLGSAIFSNGEVAVPAPELTIKATGYQWYWGYEYMDDGVNFASIMLTDEQRAQEKPDEPRLLAVDQELVVPVDTTVRVLVTGADVIHAFAVPSFGIKVDAVPGRNNETWFYARETGMYYGQCSELCGKDHAFMPIAVRVVSQEQFDAWIAQAGEGDLAGANALLAQAE
ncbi:cytochrome c oxidase subunit II [Pelagibacterium halotolerans]|uniref:cytochrome c oxidase subunit II n=1 Tax=Pelagibacterium halotolerans TaxID=531813 RepID=UPI00385117BE